MQLRILNPVFLIPALRSMMLLLLALLSGRFHVLLLISEFRLLIFSFGVLVSSILTLATSSMILPSFFLMELLFSGRMCFLMRNPKARVPIPSDFLTCSGELFKPVLSGKLMPDGTIKLTQIDQIDIKAEINSYASTCDMAYILSRLKVGDVSVLSAKEGAYGDFTVFPKTYAEMLQLVQSGEDAFDALPLDVRSSFDNDINKWFATIGTDEWSEKMKIPKPVPTVDVKPAVDVKPSVDVKLAVDA